MIYDMIHEGARQYKQLEFLAGHSAKGGGVLTPGS